MSSTITMAASLGATSLSDEVKLLLPRLDLDRSGLEAVKAAQANPEIVAAELLKYYRGRKAPGHPVVAHGASKTRGHAATAEDIVVADDAVQNILIAAPVYPRYDFGKKIDWFTNRNEKSDLEWIVQLHRQYSWMYLGKAYWHTGDEKYAQAYCRQLADWLEHCSADKKGRPVWGTLEVGVRGHAWTCHFNYFLDSPGFTPDLLVRQLNSLYEHADLLTRNRKYTGNNWGLMEAEGTAFIAITFPEFQDVETWRKKAFTHLAQEIKKQVLPDGMHCEMCFCYHSGSILWLGRTAQLARLNGLGNEFPDDYDRTIERMYEVVGLCAHPNGNTSMFGDDRPHDTSEVVARGAAEFLHNDTLAFLDSHRQQGKPPARATALSSGGIYSLRSDWTPDAIHLILKCGRDGGWHCQPDNGTFELFAFGRYLMPDSGCYIYHGDDAGRKWFRQTRVHQTLTFDGKDTAYAARQLLWQTGEDLDALVVENASYKDLTHRRALFFVEKRFFVIVDEAQGSGAGDVDVHFQLAPASDPVIDTKALAVRTSFESGANLLLKAAPQEGMALEEEEGQVSLVYATKQCRPALRLRIHKTPATAGVRFVTLLLPYLGQAPAAEVQVLGNSPPGADALELKVKIGSVSYHIAYDLKQGKASLQ